MSDPTLPAPDDRRTGPVSPDEGSTAPPPAGGLTPILSAVPTGFYPPPDPVPASAPPGYQILGELGRGGMGVVYKARHVALDRVVAVKMILAGGYATEADRRRFLHEAKAAAGLRHPNVVQVYEVGEHAGLPYFTLEYVDGGSLGKYARDPLPAREAAGLVEGIARGVAAAHAAGVVHRDLKPDNILLQGARGMGQGASEDPEPSSPLAPCPMPLAPLTPKVADFGLAKKVDSGDGLTATGAVLGTPGYMAPEQARGEAKRIGPAADVYGLGAVLYRLLTGRPPFAAPTPVETLRLVLDADPPTPSDLVPRLPRDLETICLTCLRKDPVRRYPSAGAVADDLRRFLAGEPIVARPVGRPERAWKWTKRNRGPVAVAATVFVALLAGAGVATWQWRQADRARGQAQTALTQVTEEQGRTRTALAENERVVADLTASRQRNLDALRTLTDQMVGERIERQAALTDRDRQFLRVVQKLWEEVAAAGGDTEEARALRAEGTFRVAKLRKSLAEHAEAEAGYRRALELYRGLVADFPAHPGHRSGLADTQTVLGLLLATTGQPTDAEQAYRDALATYRTLAADFPADPKYHDGLATNHNNLGMLLQATGRPADAEQAYRDALAAWQKLAADFPADPRHRQGLAAAHGNLGYLLQTVGRPADAERAHRDGLAVRQKLATDFPADPGYRHSLARSHTGLGLLLQTTFRWADAERAYGDALTVLRRLAAEFPANPGYRDGLALVHNNLGALLVRTGRLADGERAYGDALAAQKRLAADFPTVSDYPNGVAGTLGNMAILALRRGELAEARRLLDEAIPYHRAALRAHPRNPEYRQFFHNNLSRLAAVLLALGEHAAVPGCVAELLSYPDEPAPDTYDAACYLARCVPLAGRDGTLYGPVRFLLARQYADRAMSYLRRAVQLGWRDAAHTKADPDLAPLRGRTDFRWLLVQLEAKHTPPGKPPRPGKP